MTDTTTQTIYADGDPEQPVRGTFHWVEVDGIGVMYEIYEQDGVEIMAPLYWRVAA